MKVHLIATGALALLLAALALAGPLPSAQTARLRDGANGGRGGGDVIYCYQGNGIDQAGYYFLDYIMATVSARIPLRTNGVDSQQVVAAIVGHLEAIDLKLGPELRKFNDVYRNLGWFPEVWMEAKLGLETLNDQELRRDPPMGCRYQLHQLIVREGRLHFKYDPVLLAEMRRMGPLQDSMAEIHEWLRDYTSDPESIRDANAYLHSDQFLDDPRTEVVKNLRGILQTP